jgi:hypothetical protein
LAGGSLACYGLDARTYAARGTGGPSHLHTPPKWLRRLAAVWLVLSVALSAGAAPSVSGDAQRATETTFDCGLTSLFLLLHLEGRATTLDELHRALPPRGPSGYSMAELASAASALGMRLEGIQFRPGAPPPDRPAIAYFKDGRFGHFAVLRPVGTTGTTVQLIDPPHPPALLDYTRLLAERTWTGQTLINANPWALRNAGPLIGTAAVLLLLIVAWRHRPRSVKLIPAQEHECEDLLPPVRTS